MGTAAAAGVGGVPVTVLVGVGVMVRVRVLVGVGVMVAVGCTVHPFSALFTAWMITATLTSPPIGRPPFEHADGWAVPRAMFTSVMRSLMATVSVAVAVADTGADLLNRKHAAAVRPGVHPARLHRIDGERVDVGVGEASVESVPGAATVGALEDAGVVRPGVECAGA